MYWQIRKFEPETFLRERSQQTPLKREVTPGEDAAMPADPVAVRPPGEPRHAEVEGAGDFAGDFTSERKGERTGERTGERAGGIRGERGAARFREGEATAGGAAVALRGEAPPPPPPPPPPPGPKLRWPPKRAASWSWRRAAASSLAKRPRVVLRPPWVCWAFQRPFARSQDTPRKREVPPRPPPLTARSWPRPGKLTGFPAAAACSS